MEIENIAFSGGGIGGLAYIGVLKLLEETGLLPKVYRYSGCSIGALFAFLIVIGYTAADLRTLMEHFRYTDIIDIQLLGILENMGLETGKHIVTLLRKMLYRKVGKYDITFDQLRQITGRELYVNASCVETDSPEYFSPGGTPDMSVIKAVHMSIAIPPVFAAVRHKGKTYVDGGLHDPFPINHFDPRTTLGFLLANEGVALDDVHPFVTHMYNIIRSLYRRIKYTQSYTNYTVVPIKTGTTTLKINLSKMERMNTIDSGYESFRKELFKILNNK